MAKNGSYLDKFSLPLKSSFYRDPLAKKRFNFSQEEDVTKESNSIKIYLRIKPYEDSQLYKNGIVFEVLDSSTLLVKSAPETTSSRKIYGRSEETRYIFSHIFGPEITQKELFESSVKEGVIEFINGFSSLIFSYGTTNAGKTYTVQGTRQNPGLIPRALHLVFNAIEGRQTENVEYMPFGRSVKRMSDQEQRNLVELRNIIVNAVKEESNSMKSVSPQDTDFEFKTIEHMLDNETEAIHPIKPDNSYSLWVSFFEIYNECIYDLLQPHNSNNQRKQLKISEDSSKNCYVKDLNYIHVTSVSDALKVIFYGRNNLQVATTGLNKQSSRSHCIFTLTLVSSPPIESGEEIVISQLSLCDLAGTERQKKTHNVGDRLKESQHINCSLLVLSRCFEIIRENQNKTDKSVIPYRESKLTRLFQKSLKGEEKIFMLVNVNATFSLEDTHQVLKTSAIARKTTSTIKTSQLRRRRSIMFQRTLSDHSKTNSYNSLLDSNISSPPSLMAHVLREEEEDTDDMDKVSNDLYDNQQVVESLLTTINTQKNKIESLKSDLKRLDETNFSLEQELRSELAVEYGKLIKTIEDRLKARIAEKDEVIKELKNHIELNMHLDEETNSRKRKRNLFDCSVSIIPSADMSHLLQDDVDILKKENDLLMNDIDNLKSTLAHYKNENRKINKKYTELKFYYEAENIATLKEAVLDDNMEGVLQQMENMKENFRKELNKKNELLNEALEEINVLESTQRELLNDNEKLQGDLLLITNELEEVKGALAISNEILSKKTDENQELEKNLEKLEKDNDKLLDYIEMTESQLKCLSERLASIEKDESRASGDSLEPSSIFVRQEDSRKLISDVKNCTHAESFSDEKPIKSQTNDKDDNDTDTIEIEAKFTDLSFDERAAEFFHSTISESIGLSRSEKEIEETKELSPSAIENNKSNISNYQILKQQTENGNMKVQGDQTTGRNDTDIEKVDEIESSTLLVGNIEQKRKMSDVLIKTQFQTSRLASQPTSPLNKKEKQSFEDIDGLGTQVKLKLEQRIIEMTEEIEQTKKSNSTLISLLEQCEEEKKRLVEKNCRLTEDEASIQTLTREGNEQLVYEIEKINRSNESLKAIIEESGREKKILQEEMKRLQNQCAETKSQTKVKLSELTLEMKEIKKLYSGVANLLQQFEQDKTIFQGTIEDLTNAFKAKEESHITSFEFLKRLEIEIVHLQEKLCTVSNAFDEVKQSQAVNQETLVKHIEEVKHLRDTVEMKELLLQQLTSKRQSELQENQILQDKMKNMEEMRVKIQSELNLKNDSYDTLKQDLNKLEENYNSLKNELGLKELELQLTSKRQSKLQNQILQDKMKDMEEMKVKIESELNLKNNSYDTLLQNFKTLEENYNILKNEHGLKELELQQLTSKRQSELQENQILIEKMKNLEEMRVKIESELNLRNDSYNTVLHNLKTLEENYNILKNELGSKELELQQLTSKRQSELQENQVLNDKMKNLEEMRLKLESELNLRNDSYNTVLQNLNTLEENYSILKNELALKNNNFEEKENQLNKELNLKESQLKIASRDLDLKSEEISKLRLELCEASKKNEAQSKTPSKLKSKNRPEHLEEIEDVFFTPIHHENNENRDPENIRPESSFRSARNKTMDFSGFNTSSKPTAKRITRSRAYSQSSRQAKVSAKPPSTPHAEILSDSQAALTTDKNRGKEKRRLLSSADNLIPRIVVEEFPEDPEINNESPVSTLNRLTDIPQPQRKLRTRKKN